MLLLAYRNGLSDRRAMESLRFDLRWKVALDLPIDHPGFHPTSLVKFRARLLLHGKERIVFERSLELATELGLLDGSVEQILDSTPMLGAAAIQDTVTLVRAAVRKLIDAVGALGPGAARRLRETLAFDYARPRQKPAVDWDDKTAREAILVEVAADAQRALRAVECDQDLADDETVAAAAGLLGEIVGQEFELAGDDGPRPRHGRRMRQIISAHDPEMRHGRKTNARRFTGYKLHVATDAQAPVVTAVTISPGNEHDGHHAAAVEQQPPVQTAGAGDRRHRLRQHRSPRAARAARDPGARAAAQRQLDAGPQLIARASFRSTSTSTASGARRAGPAKICEPRPSGAAGNGARSRDGLPRPIASTARLRERCAPTGRARDPHQPPRRPSAKPHSLSSPTPLSAGTSNAPGHASNGRPA